MTKINILQVSAPRVAESAHIYRQVAATFASSLLFLASGINFGFTAVLLPQLDSDSNFPYDKSFDSWIASISPLSMLTGCLFSGLTSDGMGRKMGQIVLIIPITIGWVIMGLASNNVVILIGRFITGMPMGAMRANSMVYIGEIADPKFRGIALFCPSIAAHIGCLISHTVGKYVHWKLSCFLFTLPTIITLVILMFLKESPLWLLSKGRIDDGIESFRQFRGTGESSEKELAIVLGNVKEREGTPSFRETLGMIFSLPFLKSLGIIFLLFTAMQWSGINTLSFYAQDIFEKTFSGDVDPFLFLLATDCIRVAASVIVCSFGKIIPRKITFVSCCFTTTLVLIGLVTYIYLKPTGLVWLAVTTVVLYIGLASALTSISWSFVAEIFPSKVRGFGSGLSSVIANTLLFISVKLTPDVMNKYGVVVMYAGFAVVTFITGFWLSFILPETNGKSLQEIEDTLFKKKENKNNDLLMNTRL